MIKYSTLDSFKSIDLFSLAEKYQSIYAVSPWKEWKICSSDTCRRYWGIEDKQLLERLNFMHCSSTVLDYWPIEFLFKKFKLIEEKELTLIIANDCSKNKIVGFCWGYIKQKKDLKVEIKNILLDIDDISSDEVSYLCEIAVESNYRKNGIARNLLKLYLSCQKDKNWVFTQTKGGHESSISYKWFQKLGFFTSSAINKNSMVIQASEISLLISNLNTMKA